MKQKEKIILMIICAIIFIASIVGIYFIITANRKPYYVSKDDNYEMELNVGNSNYFYNCLNENQQSLYRSFHKEINLFIAGEKSLDKNGEYNILGRFSYEEFEVSKEEASNTLAAFCYDSPTYYMLVGAHCLAYPNMICPVIEKEYIEKDKREDLEEVMTNELSELSVIVNQCDNDYDNLFTIYNYILDNTSYSKVTNIECNNIVSIFDNDNNTNSHCQGYANSLSLLCNFFGIDCLFVGSNAINHSFNVVCLDGLWYYCDVTLDDKSQRDYKYFLCGEKEYWEHFGYDVPMYNTVESEGISWQGKLPELSLVSYKKNIE